ncbi:hypothetical protein [Marinomonas shanghaiensis]|uniref:hypothetical protein n=1 Tax=Marinomonas shanghaiensis TaxID=2202418 RepID=UPI003A915E05
MNFDIEISTDVSGVYKTASGEKKIASYGKPINEKPIEIQSKPSIFIRKLKNENSSVIGINLYSTVVSNDSCFIFRQTTDGVTLPGHNGKACSTITLKFPSIRSNYKEWMYILEKTIIKEINFNELTNIFFQNKKNTPDFFFTESKENKENKENKDFLYKSKNSNLHLYIGSNIKDIIINIFNEYFNKISKKPFIFHSHHKSKYTESIIKEFDMIEHYHPVKTNRNQTDNEERNRIIQDLSIVQESIKIHLNTVDTFRPFVDNKSTLLHHLTRSKEIEKSHSDILTLSLRSIEKLQNLQSRYLKELFPNDIN